MTKPSSKFYLFLILLCSTLSKSETIDALPPRGIKRLLLISVRPHHSDLRDVTAPNPPNIRISSHLLVQVERACVDLRCSVDDTPPSAAHTQTSRTNIDDIVIICSTPFLVISRYSFSFVILLNCRAKVVSRGIR